MTVCSLTMRNFIIFATNSKSGTRTPPPLILSRTKKVEATNKVIKHYLKTRLFALKGEWPVELLYVLRAYQTTCRTTTRETLFSLACGTEAIAPIEIGMETYKTDNFQVDLNDDQVRTNLNLLKELRD